MMKNKPELPPKTEFKSFHFEQKSIDENQGIITGYLSTFGNVDLQGDRVQKGAFSKTVTEGKSRMESRGLIWPVLWMHDPEQPIGKVIDVEEDEKGLLITAQLDITMTGNGFNNPIAATVFSGFKQSYISEMSMGYLAIQKDYDKGVRNLKECAVLEASAVTALFAANPEALTTGVKSMLEQKSVCGDTSLPIGARDATWDGSAAKKQIFSYAEDGDSFDVSKLKKCFLQQDGDPQEKGSWGYPFVNIVDGSPQINVAGVKACAGALSGARNADAGGDTSGMKTKVAAMYGRINKKYADADPLTPPWEDDGKTTKQPAQRKTFQEHYNEEMAEDLLEDLQEVWFVAFCKSIVDAFKIGDEPEVDISEALDAFKAQFMKDFVPRAMECNMSEYLATDDMDSPLRNIYGYGYGYMSRREKPHRKAGRAISAATQGTLQQHQAEMKDMLDAMSGHVDTMQQKVSDLTQIWQQEDQGDPYNNDKSRVSRREPPQALARRDDKQPLLKSTVDDAIADLEALLTI